MGLFGGSSSSSTTNNTQTEANSSTVGVSGANQGVLLSNINRSTITMTDGGAVSAALQSNGLVTQQATEKVTGLASQLTTDLTSLVRDITNSVTGDALRTTERATMGAMEWAATTAKANDASTSQELGKYFAYAMAAVGVAFALRGKW
ncbi:hypothetical protein [Vibrio sp. SCSIO 43137]|uniref:hypothetical protein n=1 Tax=Vibrio sp. SCSIO 43137 TaxID=3021011 RepID=UPI002307BF8B|nr:hypothetical protein [Vibrio sp. SCSIO 43137]WCE31110.1 hypothetical protein PK654_07550 [Vibrio sp. SCSIO 43137]